MFGCSVPCTMYIVHTLPLSFLNAMTETSLVYQTKFDSTKLAFLNDLLNKLANIVSVMIVHIL